LIFTEVIQDK